MIEDNEQLAATLDYISKWADMLEGMRRYEVDKGGGFFPISMAGPLGEIRKNLVEARDFLHKQQPSNSSLNGSQPHSAVPITGDTQ